MLIGCHVSISGGVQNAPARAAELGAEVMQIFSRSPRGGNAPILTAEICQQFRSQSLEFKILNTYIHTPYYINFASTNNRIRHGSVAVVRDELERGTLLGASYVMTHLGSAKELGNEKGKEKTIEMLRKTLEGYNGTTELLIENSAGAGAIIGSTLSEISEIIEAVNHKSLIGICLDTQHSYASGYDWRDFDNTINRIAEEIGIDKIRLIHANDSMAEFGSRKDRHEHIGKGIIGVEAFQKIVRFAKERDINMILETEHDAVKEDIELLKNLRKK